MSPPLGRPPITLQRAVDLHAKLLQRYGAGYRFARSDWNCLVVMACNVGINQADNLTRTGEAARLWQRHMEPSRKQGWVELLSVAAPATPEQASPAVA